MTGNRLVSDRVADLIASLAGTAKAPHGLNPIGAVIGATVPQDGRRLRQLLPDSIILAPGLGAQGGDPASIHALRGTMRGDLLIPVSRGLTRIDDRDMSPRHYRQVIRDRLAVFKAAISYDYHNGQAIPA
jgi:orotidine-5'-phosphate decarboxylase